MRRLTPCFGFSLMELLVALVLMGLVVTGVYAFLAPTINQRQTIQSYFVNVFNTQRQLAMARSIKITICPAKKGGRLSCSSGISSNWLEGWHAYQGDVLSTNTLLETYQMPHNGIRLVSGFNRLSFKPFGGVSKNGSFFICAENQKTATRLVFILVGRLRVEQGSYDDCL